MNNNYYKFVSSVDRACNVQILQKFFCCNCGSLVTDIITYRIFPFHTMFLFYVDVLVHVMCAKTQLPLVNV